MVNRSAGTRALDTPCRRRVGVVTGAALDVLLLDRGARGRVRATFGEPPPVPERIAPWAVQTESDRTIRNGNVGLTLLLAILATSTAVAFLPLGSWCFPLDVALSAAAALVVGNADPAPVPFDALRGSDGRRRWADLGMLRCRSSVPAASRH